MDTNKPKFTISIHARYEVRLHTAGQPTQVPDLPTQFISTFALDAAMPQFTAWLTGDKTRSLEVYACEQKEDGGEGASFLLYEMALATDEPRSCFCRWIIPGMEF